MKKIYLTQDICNSISMASKEKRLSCRNIAKLIEVSPATVSRICNGQITKIDIITAKRLESILNICIPNALDDEENLIERIKKLETENKMLKQLLIEKWSE